MAVWALLPLSVWRILSRPGIWTGPDKLDPTATGFIAHHVHGWPRAQQFRFELDGRAKVFHACMDSV
jgi:hypothetical protein